MQTISYLPHFISWVVTAGMITALLATILLTETINDFTGSNINFFILLEIYLMFGKQLGGVV